MIPFPDKKYKIIYADPPWSYNNTLDPNRRLPYQTMTIDQIKSLPVNDISDKDCILFIWGVFPQPREVLDVIESWEFEYKTVAFLWIKKYPNSGTWFKGMGSWTRSNGEPCHIAIKGKPKRYDKGIQQIVVSPTTSFNFLRNPNHSKKPDEVRQRIIKMCGDLPRIELFARTKIHGWDTWGNDEKLTHEPLESFSRLH